MLTDTQAITQGITQGTTRAIDQRPTSRWTAILTGRRGAHHDLDPGPAPGGPGGGRWTAAVARSLATFQLGETGGGHHLRGAVALAGRHDLLAPLELFLEEENEHARLLGVILDRLGVERLDRHWTDAVFASLRRLSGPWTELATLLMAEAVGHTYYRVMAAGAPTPGLAEVFSTIADDEELHFDFVVDVMVDLMEAWPQWRHRLGVSVFVVGAFGAAAVFAVDHRRAITAAGLRPLDAFRSCRAGIVGLATDLARPQATRIGGHERRGRWEFSNR